MRQFFRHSVPICSVLTALVVLTVLVVFSVGCGDDDNGTNGPQFSTEWTILSYGAGNNSYDTTGAEGSYVIANVQEMEKVGSSDKVKVVAMVSALNTEGNASYYYVENFPNDSGDTISSTQLDDLGNKDMSNPQTLRDFLVYGITHYPAKRYMVIIDGDGGGWRGACSDELNGWGELMSVADLADALQGALSQTSATTFNVVTFHAPLMAMAEVAYELRGVADYLVASEFVLTMGSILGSEAWLGDLVDNPTEDDEELAKAVVSAVYSAAVAEGQEAHIAAIDLSLMNRLASKIDDLGTQLRAEATGHWGDIYDAVQYSQSLVLDDTAFVDIKRFAMHLTELGSLTLVTAAADSLISAVDEAVVITKTRASESPGGGLTFHIPSNTILYDSAAYAELDFQAVGWSDFLSSYIRGLEALFGITMTIGIDPSGGGTVDIDPHQEYYHAGDTVTLTATPAEGFAFCSWTLGSEQYNDNSLTLKILGSFEITAGFSESFAVISGSMSFPEHSLVSAYAFLDTNQVGSQIIGILPTAVDGEGHFTMQFCLDGELPAILTGWDDVDQDGMIDDAEPIGWWDADGNGEWDDWLTIQPGDTISGVEVILQAYPSGGAPRTVRGARIDK